MSNPAIRDPILIGEAVTPSDVTDLSNPSRGIYVGVDGNMVCVMAGDGAAVTFTGVKGGLIYPYRVTRINATGTTATGLVALT